MTSKESHGTENRSARDLGPLRNGDLARNSNPIRDGRSPEQDPRIGSIIAERYRVCGLIGRGGMGSVYEARHVTLDRRFAMKFLLPEYAQNADVLRRFENEAKAAARLEHGHIAAVTDFGRADDGSPYLVMEYLAGRDCAALLARTGAMSIARATNIVYQACLGLSAAHQAGIVHRDVKPENLFIQETADGDEWVKILDFGIAKLRSTELSVATATGTTMGTIHYMAPEQIRDAAHVDERADVWALGVLLYELLTNQRPFHGRDVTDIIYQIVHVAPTRIDRHRSELPRALTNAIHRAIEKDPTRRFATATELGAAIRPYANRPSLPAPARIETDDTVASAEESRRRQANTSQLGATALPPSEHPTRPMWRWLAVGMIALGALSWTDAKLFQRIATIDSATAPAGSAPIALTPPPAAGSAPIALTPPRGFVNSALAPSAEPNSVVSSTGVGEDPAAASTTRRIETVRSGHGSTSDSSNSAAQRADSTGKAELPRAEPPVPIASAPTAAPHEPPVSPPPASPKATHRAHSNDGVPITIDTSNPF